MGARPVGGLTSTGCGVFGLLGLLVGVGLVAYLGSRVLTDVGGTGGGTSGGYTQLDLRVTPARAVDDGARVHLATEGFAPGSSLRATICLGTSFTTRADMDSCDLSTAVPSTADAAGRAGIFLPARRIITIDGDRYDCAAPSGGCSIVVFEVANLTRVAVAPLRVSAVPATVDATIPPG